MYDDELKGDHSKYLVTMLIKITIIIDLVQLSGQSPSRLKQNLQIQRPLDLYLDLDMASNDIDFHARSLLQLARCLGAIKPTLWDQVGLLV